MGVDMHAEIVTAAPAESAETAPRPGVLRGLWRRLSFSNRAGEQHATVSTDSVGDEKENQVEEEDYSISSHNLRRGKAAAAASESRRFYGGSGSQLTTAAASSSPLKVLPSEQGLNAGPPGAEAVVGGRMTPAVRRVSSSALAATPGAILSASSSMHSFCNALPSPYGARVDPCRSELVSQAVAAVDDAASFCGSLVEESRMCSSLASSAAVSANVSYVIDDHRLLHQVYQRLESAHRSLLSSSHGTDRTLGPASEGKTGGGGGGISAALAGAPPLQAAQRWAVSEQAAGAASARARAAYVPAVDRLGAASPPLPGSESAQVGTGFYSPPEVPRNERAPGSSTRSLLDDDVFSHADDSLLSPTVSPWKATRGSAHRPVRTLVTGNDGPVGLAVDSARRSSLRRPHSALSSTPLTPSGFAGFREDADDDDADDDADAGALAGFDGGPAEDMEAVNLSLSLSASLVADGVRERRGGGGGGGGSSEGPDAEGTSMRAHPLDSLFASNGSQAPSPVKSGSRGRDNGDGDGHGHDATDDRVSRAVAAAVAVAEAAESLRAAKEQLRACLPSDVLMAADAHSRFEDEVSAGAAAGEDEQGQREAERAAAGGGANGAPGGKTSGATGDDSAETIVSIEAAEAMIAAYESAPGSPAHNAEDAEPTVDVVSDAGEQATLPLACPLGSTPCELSSSPSLPVDKQSMVDMVKAVWKGLGDSEVAMAELQEENARLRLALDRSRRDSDAHAKTESATLLASLAHALNVEQCEHRLTKQCYFSSAVLSIKLSQMLLAPSHTACFAQLDTATLWSLACAVDIPAVAYPVWLSEQLLGRR